YKDGKKKKKLGFRKQDIELRFSYSHHLMDLSRILTAEYIEIDFGGFPVPFSIRKFVMQEESIVKNWFNGLVFDNQESGEYELVLTSYKESQLVNYPERIFAFGKSASKGAVKFLKTLLRGVDGVSTSVGSVFYNLTKLFSVSGTSSSLG